MNVRSPFHSFLVMSLVLLPAAVAFAQQPLAFGERPVSTLVTPQFTDREITQLTSTLDGLIASAGSPSEVRTALWNFVRQLQAGKMTKLQETRVLKHLDQVARARGRDATVVAGARRMLTNLTIGKVAPEILGRDLDGATLRLSDYRGKVVVVLFSAEWCGICRTLNPYERMMLEMYKNWPFAMVSVETGSSTENTKRNKAREGLTYRSWWDGPSEEGNGPIASAWNVGGFPTLYVLDAQGVVRFVDLRYEDLLKGVRQLLNEHMEELEQAARTSGPALEAKTR